MTKANAIKMLTKAGGTVRQDATGRYWAYVDRYEVSFRMTSTDPDAVITCESARPIGEQDDLHSDYHAGSYFPNLTQAIRYARSSNFRMAI